MAPGAFTGSPLKMYWLLRFNAFTYSCRYLTLAAAWSNVDERRIVSVSVPLPTAVSPWYQPPGFPAPGPALLLLPCTDISRSIAKLVPHLLPPLGSAVSAGSTCSVCEIGVSPVLLR